MRAAKNKRVNAMASHWRQVFAQDATGQPVIHPAFLDEGHEQGAGPGKDLRGVTASQDAVAVGFAPNGGAGADDADAFGARALQRRPDTGQNDAKNGNLEFFLQHRQGPRRASVASDYDG